MLPLVSVPEHRRDEGHQRALAMEAPLVLDAEIRSNAAQQGDKKERSQLKRWASRYSCGFYKIPHDPVVAPEIEKTIKVVNPQALCPSLYLDGYWNRPSVHEATARKLDLCREELVHTYAFYTHRLHHSAGAGGFRLIPPQDLRDYIAWVREYWPGFRNNVLLWGSEFSYYHDSFAKDDKGSYVFGGPVWEQRREVLREEYDGIETYSRAELKPFVEAKLKPYYEAALDGAQGGAAPDPPGDTMFQFVAKLASRQADSIQDPFPFFVVTAEGVSTGVVARVLSGRIVVSPESVSSSLTLSWLAAQVANHPEYVPGEDQFFVDFNGAGDSGVPFLTWTAAGGNPDPKRPFLYEIFNEFIKEHVDTLPEAVSDDS